MICYCSKLLLEEVDNVNIPMVAAFVAEDDALLLEAAADADVEVLVPPAVLVDACASCSARGCAPRVLAWDFFEYRWYTARESVVMVSSSTATGANR